MQNVIDIWTKLDLRRRIIVAALFAYQQLLIQDRKPDDCFKAFLNNNWVGATVFFGIALDYAFR